MPFSQLMEKNVLDYWFGDSSPTVPGTFYVGLVIQLGQLSTAITAGATVTSLACSSTTTGYNVAANDVILLGSGSSTQVFQATTTTASGASSLAVTSAVANQAFAIGTPFIRCDAFPASVGGGGQEPTGNAYARVSVTNNTTNWPSSSISGDVAQKQNGTAITFPQATGSWGTVAGFLIGDNATSGSGNLFAYGALNAAQAISTGNTPSFAADQLTITLL